MKVLIGVLSAWYLGLCLASCGTPSLNKKAHMPADDSTHKYTNALVHETSPYLLQHAHNPVHWYPWGEEALKKAREEDKMLLVSVGYSACHWCHVMEHESFEDTAVAELMNAHFVCIKVDREERPDIDQVYMDAVQLLTKQGGWPLNCFALPDGRPFYGGTYFPKEAWIDLLGKVADQYTNNREEVVDFANKLTQGVVESDLIERNPEKPFFHVETLETSVNGWAQYFDNHMGGPNRAPKFPLPNNYQFLLRYAHLQDDRQVLKHVELTLDEMAFGGIYDQLGGGFARYSVDMVWKVPHFEKMLYDNAQLISLYSEAYLKFRKPLYRDVVYETIAFCERELSNGSGVFYSALDADSEGEEGKFYVWTESEFSATLGEQAELAKAYYNVNRRGLWEHGNYILLRNKEDADFAKKHDLELEAWLQTKEEIRKKLFAVRDQRIRPGLDDKSLTSWNALMLKGLTDAYLAFGEPRFRELALQTGHFLTQTQRHEDGGLWHSFKKGDSRIPGYLEDYCFTIEGLIGLYEATFDERWLQEADRLAQVVIERFYNAENGMFYFTSHTEHELVARKTEYQDNVIPASNSSMAKGLFYLGHLMDKPEYLDMAQTQLNNVQRALTQYGSQFSNWSQLLLHHTHPFYEIAFTGAEAGQKRNAWSQVAYHPNRLLIGTEQPSDLPLLQHKPTDGETMIYVCLNKTCQLPTPDVQEALKQVQ